MGGNFLYSGLPAILECTPQLTAYDGQVGLRANEGWKSLIQPKFTQVQYLYLLFGK